MKQFIAITIILFFAGTPVQSQDIQLKKWGYVFHASKLSDDYIHKTIPKYNTLGITGWQLNAKGEIIASSEIIIKKCIKIANKNKVEVYPVISFISPAEGGILLKSDEAVKAALSNISRLVRKQNFTGINLDLEYLTPDYSYDLARFLGLLRKRLNKTKITMTLFPQVDFPEEWGGFHNPSIIGEYLDQVILMCYDYRRQGTDPGPVTDIKWTEKNIQHILKYFKPEQVWLGIPAYGYRWGKNNKAEALSAKTGSDLAKKYGSIRHSSGNVYFSYSSEDKMYRVFFSDQKTIELLTERARSFRLAGTALWRLGFEE